MLLNQEHWYLYNERYDGPFSEDGLEIAHCGRVTFVSGWELPTHSHASYEICLVTLGSCFYHVNNRSYELQTGDLCLTKPGELHSMSGIGDNAWGKLYIGFRSVEPEELKTSLDNCRMRYTRSCADLIQGFTRIIDEFRQPQFGSSYMVQAQMTVILYDILRRIGISQHSTVSAYSHPVHQARDYIELSAYYRQPVSEVARHVNLSESRLAHLFSSEMGISVYAYIRQVLMQRAASMLEDGKLSITEVADTLGFPSSNYFSTAFSKHWGVTPSQYRAGNRKQENSGG